MTWEIRTMERPAASAAEGAPSEIDIGSETVASGDPRMRAVYVQIRTLAPTRLPILVIGESGVGKELVARALHANSPSRAGPFMPINCGALPAGLVESEFFGHERGAFSGATEATTGLLEAGSGGTVFLDEIGEFPLELQARLLRFLDDHIVRRVGAISGRRVDVRVVSATNRDLQALVAAGRFREDLFHRLAGALLEVPTLRERPADILRLANELLVKARERSGAQPLILSDSAALAILRYRWPGNVRELKHAMEYVGATAGSGQVLLEHLPSPIQRAVRVAATGEPAPRGSGGPRRGLLTSPGATVIPLKERVDELVRRSMLEALDAARWNVARASRLLRMSRRTFIKKMKAYGLRDLHHED